MNQTTLRQFGLTRAGNKKSLSADNNDLLAEEKLLGNNGSESAQKVALAVNNDSIRHDQSTNDLAILSIAQSGLVQRFDSFYRYICTPKIYGCTINSALIVKQRRLAVSRKNRSHTNPPFSYVQSLGL